MMDPGVRIPELTGNADLDTLWQCMMTFTVAHVISSYNSKSGGPPRSVTQLSRAGAAHWQSVLFTTAYRQSSPDSLLVGEFMGPVVMLPAKCTTAVGGLSMLAGLSRVHVKLLRDARPDVLHIHGLWNPFLGAFARAAVRERIPYIVAPRGMLEPWALAFHRGLKQVALKTYQGYVLSHAAALHATSQLEADNLRGLRISEAPVFVVPNSVEAPGPSIAGQPTPTAAPRQKTMLFLSRIHEKKGIELLLQAWNALRPDGWRLLIVGSGEAEYVRRLEEYTRNNAMAGVEFREHAGDADKEVLFAQSSAFVLPTYSENFGNVIAEALMSGLPVITTTGTPWSDLVRERCGWYIEPEIHALQRALSEAMDSPAEELCAMGERGSRYARARFSVEAIRDPLLRIYRSVISR